MKKVLSFLCAICVVVSAMAVPAKDILRTIIQPDGKELSIRLIGDEYFHFWKTSDGLILQENENGCYCYAKLTNGMLVATEIVAHNPEQREEFEIEYVTDRVLSNYDRCIIDSIKQKHNVILKRANDSRSRRKIKSLGKPTSYTGKKKGLVILVNFANLSMTSETANSDFDRMFNENGYNDNGSEGSVHDYFYDQSYGKFDLTFDVVGPVTVSENYSYYGNDNLSGSIDVHVREMVSEACQLADENVDYKNYDWDNDGIVDQVYFIYAGYGQATGAPNNTIWPHESYLVEELELDGVKISQYACSNELYGYNTSKKMFMGIGTACHEFSHCLGLPDLYDTDYSGAFGMSYWDVMNSGSYNGANGIGEVPCGYSAYERWFAGWLSFIEVETSQHIESLPNIGDSATAYKITNDGYSDEYFILENRQPDKWFKYTSTFIGLHGLLVTHVDYDLNAWTSNKVNPKPSHQRMSPVVADNSYGTTYDNLAGDLFPGAMNVVELTHTSHTDYGGKLFNMNTDGSYCMNKNLYQITENEGVISLDVVFENQVPAPMAVKPQNLTSSSFLASWTSEVDADSYSIEIELVKTSIPFVNEIVQIDNILQTSYLVENISGEYCRYKVRAVKDGIHSEWSNIIAFSLPNSDGITEIKENDKDIVSPIYTINGQRVTNPQKGTLYIRNKEKFILK